MHNGKVSLNVSNEVYLLLPERFCFPFVNIWLSLLGDLCVRSKGTFLSNYFRAGGSGMLWRGEKAFPSRSSHLPGHGGLTCEWPVNQRLALEKTDVYPLTTRHGEASWRAFHAGLPGPPEVGGEVISDVEVSVSGRRLCGRWAGAIVHQIDNDSHERLETSDIILQTWRATGDLVVCGDTIAFVKWCI